eukprot:768818-Hanusia_phi.AAC.3
MIGCRNQFRTQSESLSTGSQSDPIAISAAMRTRIAASTPARPGRSRVPLSDSGAESARAPPGPQAVVG